MKKSDIEKQLKKQLSDEISSDFQNVWDKCSTPEYEKSLLISEAVEAHSGHMSHTKRSKVAIMSVIMAAILCCVAIICIVLSGKTRNGLFMPLSEGYFTIDVNPSLQVNYNKKGVITSVEGLNNDGEEFLNGISIDGRLYNEAVEIIFDGFVEQGYFSNECDDNAMLVTASKLSGEKDEKMTEEIKKYFSQSFANKKMSGFVISDVDNAKWQKEAKEYGINSQKYDMIQKFLDMGGNLNDSEYESISIRELYSLMRELEKNSKDK